MLMTVLAFIIGGACGGLAMGLVCFNSQVVSDDE
jgi:hypothetical protein